MGHKKTRATPAHIPRSRSNTTRAKRLRERAMKRFCDIALQPIMRSLNYAEVGKHLVTVDSFDDMPIAQIHYIHKS